MHKVSAWFKKIIFLFRFSIFNSLRHVDTIYIVFCHIYTVDKKKLDFKFYKPLIANEMIKQLKTCKQIFIENDFESHKYFFY